MGGGRSIGAMGAPGRGSGGGRRGGGGCPGGGERRVPPDTVLLRWLLHVSQGSPSCTDEEITVHFRYGAPPVINPLGTSFPDNTLSHASFHIRALLSTLMLDNTSVNISHPAPGDWFLVAHLPPSSQKIQVKGFVPTCAYIFQPDMLVMRVVEVSTLEPDVPLPQTLLSYPSYLKIFVPEYTQELRLELQGCVSSVSPGCPVRVTVGATTLPRNFQRVLTCTGLAPSCHLLLSSPPWGRWLQVTFESLAEPHVTVGFTAKAVFTVCRPWSVTIHHLIQNNPNQTYDTSAIQLSQSAVYFYTMFFSTFYHACDQPGEAVLCILSYDTLQYCDFLGSGASTWVTILCMARLKTILKQVLLVLGTLVIAMSLQMDRRGIWNLMGPCVFAFVIMASMWIYRCGHRGQCYPTSWQRWVFYLLPGISMASVGIAMYTSMMTSDNYYYTHSIWHILLAGSAAFLLPPREEKAGSWACLQKFPCHYQICRNDRDELYTVT